jgi:hypothetical protein
MCWKGTARRRRRQEKDRRSRLAISEDLVRESRVPRPRDGPVVLVIHGITQGADGGLRDLAEELVPDGYPALVPSRFGYLGSAMPEGTTPEDSRPADRLGPCGSASISRSTSSLGTRS